MGSCYASLTGTAVVQRKDVPPRPPFIEEAAYNTTSYDRTHGGVGPYSGWCSFEQAVSMMVAAHLRVAAEQAGSRGHELPERLTRAMGARAKVTDISGGEVRKVDKVGHRELLAEAMRDISGATFVGKGEAEMVQQMLAEFEWLMKTAMEQATSATDSSRTVAPAVLREARIRSQPAVTGAPNSQSGGSSGLYTQQI
jgi:hypothetical protein